MNLSLIYLINKLEIDFEPNLTRLIYLSFLIKIEIIFIHN